MLPICFIYVVLPYTYRCDMRNENHEWEIEKRVHVYVYRGGSVRDIFYSLIKQTLMNNNSLRKFSTLLQSFALISKFLKGKPRAIIARSRHRHEVSPRTDVGDLTERERLEIAEHCSDATRRWDVRASLRAATNPEEMHAMEIRLSTRARVRSRESRVFISRGIASRSRQISWAK